MFAKGSSGGSCTGSSPAGLSPAGLSPAGLSPAGLSPAGLSPAGLSPAGSSPAGLSAAPGSPSGVVDPTSPAMVSEAGGGGASLPGGGALSGPGFSAGAPATSGELSPLGLEQPPSASPSATNATESNGTRPCETRWSLNMSSYLPRVRSAPGRPLARMCRCQELSGVASFGRLREQRRSLRRRATRLRGTFRSPLPRAGRSPPRGPQRRSDRNKRSPRSRRSRESRRRSPGRLDRAELA